MSEKEDNKAYVIALLKICEDHLSRGKADRDLVQSYYEGGASDLVPKGEDYRKSTAVNPVMRSVIRRVKPSIMRTFLHQGTMGSFAAKKAEDEKFARQATEYVNGKTIPEGNIDDAIYDALMDAMLYRTGILKSVVHRETTATNRDIQQQPLEELLGVEGEWLAYEETLDERGNVYVTGTLRTETIKHSITLEAVPRDKFLIHPDAKTIEDAPLVGEWESRTRSDLVAMGYDREVVYALPAENKGRDDGKDYTFDDSQVQKSVERVTYYEVYAKIDQDDDGITELYKICIGGEAQQGAAEILSIERVDDAPYYAVRCERVPHEFEGYSVAEDLVGVQRIVTILLRQVLDNTYAQTDIDVGIQPDALTPEGYDAVMRPEAGKVIELKTGYTLADAVQYMNVPFIANSASEMMQYWAQQGQEVTGITDASGGLDATHIANVTATTAQLMSNAGAAQADLMLRSMRKGIKDAFQGMLKLIVAYGEPTELKVSDKWEAFAPQDWPDEMTFEVNIGQGAGDRQQDLSALHSVLQMQKEIIRETGVNNPLVLPEQLYNTISRIVETAGLNNTELYFTRPENEQVLEQAAKAAGQPTEAQMKLEAEMKLETMKTEARTAVEKAQAQADIMVNQHRIDREAEIERERLNQQERFHNDKMAIERVKITGLQEII